MVNINGKPDLYEISMALSNCTGLQNESTTMFIPWNETENQSHEARMEKIIHYYTMEISVPIVCAFGMIGNVLNFIVLTREKISHSLTKMEKSAHIGLIGLAISDFMFCLLAFMYTQIEFKDEYGVQNSVMYFEWLSGPLITWFILTSTWLTVSMAGERYLAVCHPFKARKLISLKKTRIITLIVYVMCLALSIPLIFEKTVVEHTNCEGYVYYKLETHPLFTDSVLGMRRLVWAVLFDFIPCVALLYFNACLIYKIHHAKKLRNAMAPAQNQEVLLTKYPRELFSYNSDSATTNASVKTRQNASFHNSNSTKSHRTFNNKSWHCSPQHSSLKNSLPQKKQMRAKRRQTDYALNSVTATLVAVVVLFLVLVSPSEIIKFIYTVTVGTHTTTYKIILKITNLMQAVNFSVNFILYCGVNKSFRMSLAAIFCFFCRRGHRAFELRSLERAYCHRMEFSESES